MPNVMAALSNIGGALYKSSLTPFLVPRRGLRPLLECRAGPCSNADNIGQGLIRWDSER